MSWALRRQLTYLFFVFLVFAIIGFFVYQRLTSVEPTCYDGKKNSDEVGVDCGGSCSFYCRDELAAPKVRWVRFFDVAPGLIHAVAYIEHSYPTAAARTAGYEFNIYDEKNNLIMTRQGKTYIGPMGRSALVETLIPVGNGAPELARFSFLGDIPWEKVPGAYSQVVIKTDRTLLEDFSGGTRLTATLENQSRMTFTDIDVVAILYDKDDNAIAVTKALLQELPAQQNTTMYFTWPHALKDKAARVEILPRLNAFAAEEL